MKQATFLLLTLLLTSSYNCLAKEKEQPEQKQLTTSGELLPPVQLARCNNYPECGKGDSIQSVTTSLVDWLKKQMTISK
jgi:hypothetical protein